MNVEQHDVQHQADAADYVELGQSTELVAQPRWAPIKSRNVHTSFQRKLLMMANSAAIFDRVNPSPSALGSLSRNNTAMSTSTPDHRRRRTGIGERDERLDRIVRVAPVASPSEAARGGAGIGDRRATLPCFRLRSVRERRSLSRRSTGCDRGRSPR